MKCTNKLYLSILLSVSIFLCGCSSSKYQIPYTADSNISSFGMVNSVKVDNRCSSFADKLCITEGNIKPSGLSLSDTLCAGLFNIQGREVIVSQNVFDKVYPASLTKIMTAIVALKNGSSDMVLTATGNVKITEPGAQLIGLEPGDTMTLSQALNILLIYSANDVAVLIAEGIAGSEEAFVEMMNKEALSIGATNTHFANPHGLTAEEHYTTGYDLYLILNEAIQYEAFNEIIHTPEYSTVYYDSAGNTKEVNIKTTNLYLSGDIDMPSGVTVIGGKTGTTKAAGHCLIMLSRDTKSNPYISIIMKADNREDLYTYMTSVLKHIND